MVSLGLLDIALKDYIFFNDAKTKCDTHILNNFDGKAGEYLDIIPHHLTYWMILIMYVAYHR